MSDFMKEHRINEESTTGKSFLIKLIGANESVLKECSVYCVQKLKLLGSFQLLSIIINLLFVGNTLGFFVDNSIILLILTIIWGIFIGWYNYLIINNSNFVLNQNSKLFNVFIVLPRLCITCFMFTIFPEIDDLNMIQNYFIKTIYAALDLGVIFYSKLNIFNEYNLVLYNKSLQNEIENHAYLKALKNNKSLVEDIYRKIILEENNSRFNMQKIDNYLKELDKKK